MAGPAAASQAYLFLEACGRMLSFGAAAEAEDTEICVRTAALLVVRLLRTFCSKCFAARFCLD